MYEDNAATNENALDRTQTFSDGDKSVITTFDIGIKTKKKNRIRSKSHESNRVLVEDIDYHPI